MDEKEKGSSQFIDDWKEIVDTCELPENSVERYEYIQTQLKELMDGFKTNTN